MLLSSLFVCIGQLLWKLSAEGLSLYLILGFLCYGTGAIFMLVAYRYGSLSVLHPMLSMSYVFSTVLGIAILGEAVGPKRIFAVALILLGVIFIGGGDGE